MDTTQDILKLKMVYGADLVGEYGFPALDRCTIDAQGLKPVPFNVAKTTVDTKNSMCHFFIDDSLFERIWRTTERYIPILQNFKAVCSPDFSCYGEMPKALEIYQRYRTRAMAKYMQMNNIPVIPTVGWGGFSTYDYCFDGLPMESVLAVSTNGCQTAGRQMYIDGFREMCYTLKPKQIVCVGRPIKEVEDLVEIIYFDSHGQQMKKR